MSLLLTIKTDGLASTIEDVQSLRSGLARRGPLHEQISIKTANFTRSYVGNLNRHKTALSLQAKPTGHHTKAAKRIEHAHDDEAAIIRIPTATGLGRAFHDVVIRPGSGKTYLTIPASQRTYGRSVREFPIGTFAFTIIGGRFTALVFREGWTLAYWLRRSVSQKQDRTLLPSDEIYLRISNAETDKWVSKILKGGEA